MSTERQQMPGEGQEQNTSGEQSGNETQKSTEISLPRIDRPEGPFQHSGEVAGWTKEEKEEKTDQEQQGGNQ